MSRRLAIWFVLVTLFVALVVGSALSASSVETDVGKPIVAQSRTFSAEIVQEGDGADVAMVPVIGEIQSGASTAAGTIAGAQDIVLLLDAIAKEDKVDAVILELNTPGGGVLASAEISDAVKRVTAKGIPVVAWMRDYAASGGYYIGVNADHIVAHPATITGSIGVILQYVNIQGLAKKVGVSPVTIKSGPLKDMASPYRDLSVEERKILQDLIDESYGEFVNVVDDGRKDLDEEEVRTLADGRIYTGTQAEKNGLVDELGGQSEVFNSAAEFIEKAADDDDNVKGEDLNVVRYTPSFGFWDQLGSASGPAFSLDMLMSQVQGQLLGRGAGAVAPSTGSAGGGLAQSGPAHAGLPQLEYRAVL